MLDNRNIQITITDREKNEGGIDSIETTFDFFPIFCHGILPYSA